jgi:hypothetical protein
MAKTLKNDHRSIHKNEEGGPKMADQSQATLSSFSAMGNETIRK